MARDERTKARVPYGHHQPFGKSLRESVVELAREGYTDEAIASELGLTGAGRARAARWTREL